MDIQEFNGTSLAYIGDAIMSLYVREFLLECGFQKSKVLQKKSENWVSAKAQAYFVRKLEAMKFFRDEEWKMYLRGRNTHSQSKAKNADVVSYRMSTGLEAVFGFLYLTKQEERLEDLWQAIKEIGELQ